MRKLWSIGVAFVGLLACPAWAADLAVKGRPAFAPPPPVWSGWYIGANVGGGIASGTLEDKDCFFCASDSFQKGFAEVGGQIGYNWQFGSTVLGIEADLNWNSLDYSGFIGLDDGIGARTEMKLNAFGSVRARAGLAFDRTLVYVTAGPAWGHLQASANAFCQASFCTDNPFRFVTWNTDSWRVGLLAGAGVDFMIAPNWILRGEYLVLALTDTTVTSSLPCANSDAPFQCRFGFGVTEQIARVGLNYQFGGPGYGVGPGYGRY